MSFGNNHHGFRGRGLRDIGRHLGFDTPARPSRLKETLGIGDGQFRQDANGKVLLDAGGAPILRQRPHMSVGPNQAKEWRLPNGQLHREDGPARMVPWTINQDSQRLWYIEGQLHRVDGPAIENEDGSEEWYQHGLRHRDGGPAIIAPNGTQAWYWYGKKHRDDGPAFIQPGSHQSWYRYGEKHRENGPAVIYDDGQEEYWLHHKQYTYENFCAEQGLVNPARQEPSETETLSESLLGPRG